MAQTSAGAIKIQKSLTERWGSEEYDRKKREWGRKGGTKNKGKKLNEANPMWKGDEVGYTALHDWVKRRVPKPPTCIDCGLDRPLDLANISQDYKRDITDWEWICHKCHTTKDGRAARLIMYSKSRALSDEQRLINRRASVAKHYYKNQEKYKALHRAYYYAHKGK